jgi:hypothetical protein
VLEIAGNNLALLVNTHRMAQLFIFDWKMGHKRLICSYAYPSPFSFLNISLFGIATSKFGEHLLW